MSQQRGGAPRMSPAGMAGRTVFIVVIAAALGLLVLKNGFSSGGSSSASSATTVPKTTTTLAPIGTTTTTAAAPNPASIKVLVANASGVGGTAGKWSTSLQGCGFTMLPATNAEKSGQATTQVFFVPNAGSEQQGGVVAAAVGVPLTGPLPSASPVKNVADAGVVVVVGKDKVNGQATCAPAPGGSTASSTPATTAKPGTATTKAPATTAKSTATTKK